MRKRLTVTQDAQEADAVTLNTAIAANLKELGYGE
jgi:hypothetical protein